MENKVSELILHFSFRQPYLNPNLHHRLCTKQTQRTWVWAYWDVSGRSEILEPALQGAGAPKAIATHGRQADTSLRSDSRSRCALTSLIASLRLTSMGLCGTCMPKLWNLPVEPQKRLGREFGWWQWKGYDPISIPCEYQEIILSATNSKSRKTWKLSTSRSGNFYSFQVLTKCKTWTEVRLRRENNAASLPNFRRLRRGCIHLKDYLFPINTNIDVFLGTPLLMDRGCKLISAV